MSALQHGTAVMANTICHSFSRVLLEQVFEVELAGPWGVEDGWMGAVGQLEG